MLPLHQDGRLSHAEVVAYFKEVHNQEDIPDGLWDEDADGDGFIDWEEFNGPKGAAPDRDEL